MSNAPALKTALKRGALIAAANWPLVVVQFVAESTLKLILGVPVVGGIFLVVLLLQARLPANIAYLVPTLIVLVVLAVPPILSNTYAGVEGVDPAVRDAAFGMGMTGPQVLARVEVPNALPLIVTGIRRRIERCPSTV